MQDCCGGNCALLFGDEDTNDLKLRPPPLAGVLASFIGTFIVICVTTAFYFSPAQLFACLVFVVLLSTLAIQEGSAWERKYPSSIFFVPLGLISALLPLYIGIKIYVGMYAPYYLAVSARDYFDVPPDGRAAEYADGGIFHFGPDAALDTTRSFGFQGSDATYCAAPVVSRTASVHPHSRGQKISFWAVGKDCCGNRADFECDGAGDLEVRNAFAINELRRDLVTRFLVPASSREMYLKAVQAAKALHGLESENVNHVILLRWAAQPDQTLGVWHNRAIGACIIACAIYSIFIAILWTSIHVYFLRGLGQTVKGLKETRQMRVKDPFSLESGGR